MTDTPNWRLHWLEATGDLSAYKALIEAARDEALHALQPYVPVGSLDILIEAGEEGVIPTLGFGASPNRPNLMSLMIDPSQAVEDDGLWQTAMTRRIVHSTYLCHRLAGPGYGFTLGGALVSEGLASVFTRLVLQSPPEPWEVAQPDDQLRSLWPDAATLMSTKYDHGEWFSGTGVYPEWLGYGLARLLAEEWLMNAGPITPERLVSVPAPKVLERAQGLRAVG